MKPYSQDLRQRIFGYALTHAIRETARHYHVSPNTVFLLRQRLFDTGTLQPKTPVHRSTRLLTPDAELQSQAWLAETPALTLQARCDLHAEAYGCRVGLTTLHNALQRLGLTRQRKTFPRPAEKHPTSRSGAGRVCRPTRPVAARASSLPRRNRRLSQYDAGLWPLTPWPARL